MRATKTLLAAAVIAVTAVSANAGGLAPVVVDTPVVIVDTPPPVSSISSGYIVLGVLAALVAASASF